MKWRTKTVKRKYSNDMAFIGVVSFQKTKGFTLLEVLVAILILSVGVIAGLGLQIVSVKSSVDAKYQSASLELAADLAAMMRSNPNISTLANSTSNPYLLDLNKVAPSGSATSTDNSSLSPLNRAKYDAAQWYARLYNTLPAARVLVCFDDEPYDAKGVPQWACSTSGANLYIKIGWSLKAGATGDDQMDSGTPRVVVPVGVCNDDGTVTAKISCYGS